MGKIGIKGNLEMRRGLGKSMVEVGSLRDQVKFLNDETAIQPATDG
jgi:hypothetical protein